MIFITNLGICSIAPGIQINVRDLSLFSPQYVDFGQTFLSVQCWL